ncbi:MAG TPA: tRNA pseudouridine(38-40) synthase TruA [Gaiellaceae bacterium]
MRLKLTLAYDGTGFRGWAAQPGLRTVEAALREALDTIFPAWSGLAIAGRTDRGVHALANVASVDAEGGPGLERVAEALNTALPDDVAVVSAGEAARDFNARFDAISRTYRYRVWRSRLRSPFETRRSWWYPRPLDVARMHAQAVLLIGEHDFTAFTRTETEHKVFARTVQDARWFEEGDVLVFEITADSFLRHMVRTLVGTMVDGVDLAPLFDGGKRDEAGQTAPSWGLYLARVAYD